MKARVKNGQNLFDMAIQEMGSALSVVELALVNGLSVTGGLTVGQELNIPDAFPHTPSPENGEKVRYIAEDLYLWYMEQLNPKATTGGTDIDLEGYVKYTPQDSTETEQQSARENLGIEDEPIPDWSTQFLQSLNF